MTVIGVDAHKRSHTMVAVDAGGRKLGVKTVAATTEGHFAALRWARDTYGTDLLWGVEDTRATTAGLERDLTDAGQSVVRVPTQLMARARTSGRERGKSDPIDALAVARAVLANPDLPVARHSRASREIKLLADHREDLLKHRTAMINRLLWRIHELDPTHTVRSTALVQRKNQLEMAQWLAPQTGIVAELARAELTAITTITPDINALERRLTPLVRAVAPELLDMYGCATKTAARIVGEAADISRFRSESAFVRYAGCRPCRTGRAVCTAGCVHTKAGGTDASTAPSTRWPWCESRPVVRGPRNTADAANPTPTPVSCAPETQTGTHGVSAPTHRPRRVRAHRGHHRHRPAQPTLVATCPQSPAAHHHAGPSAADSRAHRWS